MIVAVATKDYLTPWRTQSILSGTTAVVLIVTLLMLYRHQQAAQFRLNAYAEALKTNEAKLRRSEERLKQQVRTDPLTGLTNRRAFIEAIEAEFFESSGLALPRPCS